MDMMWNRPYYEYKSSFWPPAEIIIMVMVIVVRARNYNYNSNLCGARQKLNLVFSWCAPEFLIIIIVTSISEHSNC